MSFQHISTEAAHELIDIEDATIVDIRDNLSYMNSHIENAVHVDNQNISEFIAQADRSKPLIVVCYHGNSSQSAADFFSQQGFSQTFSLDGGFELWRTQYPTVSDN